MRKTACWLTVIAVISKLLGFLREIVMSYYYGAGEFTDIFQMSSAAGNVFLGWMLTLAVIHTPIYQEIKVTKDEKSAKTFSNQIIFIESIISVFVMTIILGTKTKIISFIASGFTNSQILVTSDFFFWSSLSIVFSALSQIFISEFNCENKIIRANISNLLVSTTQILIIFIAAQQDNFQLIKYALPISAGVQFLFLVVALNTKNRTMQVLPFTEDLKKFFVLIVPVFVSAMMDEINAFVDKSFGSGLIHGSISGLNYAHLLKQLCFYVFTTAIITLLYPQISKQVAEKNFKRTAENSQIAIDYMIFVFSYLMCFVCFFSFTIVKFVYRRGNFDDTDVLITAQSLIMYSTALLPLAVREVLIRVFQAYQDTKTNMNIAIISTAINIMLNIALVKSLKHMGLALSTSIAAYATVPILIYLYKKRNIFFNLRYTYINIVKGTVAAMISCFASWAILQNLNIQDNNMVSCFVILSVAFVLSMSFYYIILKMFKINILSILKIEKC